MSKQRYYLGLKMASSAVGWSVTDTDYNILRRRGKDMWGVHEFDAAQAAETRRTSRSNRRMIARKKARIDILRSFFAPEIEKVDPEFFARLDNSFFFMDDKQMEHVSKYGLFNDPDYTDADYYKEYPTIFHLRKELLDMDHTGKAFDVRLVYLAISNMFKHRGHFYSGVSDKDEDTLDTTQVDACWQELLSWLSEETGLDIERVPVDSMIRIISDVKLKKKDKYDAVLELFGDVKKSKSTVAFLRGMCGMNFDLNTLFSLDSEDKVTVSLSSVGFDEQLPEIEAAASDEYLEKVEDMKAVYDFAILKQILLDYRYLSLARVATYERHAEELKMLKHVYRRYMNASDYNRMFRSDSVGSYSAYVNSTNSGDLKRRRGVGVAHGKTKKELFYGAVKKDLAQCPADDADVTYILSMIEAEQFMPKQLISDNHVIPNQIHCRELRRILANAQAYLPFLNEADDSGLTVSDKIIALFTFTMPYYIGPVNTNSKTGWVVRKEDGRVLPWNFNEKIDEKASSEKFITRMTRECTYVAGEKVLPKCSLLYEKYAVLNTINAICIDGDRLSPEVKQGIYNDVFAKGKKVSKSKICDYLIKKGLITSKSQVSGVDTEIGSALSSYGKMKKIFGDKIDTPEYQAVAEEIIYWGTIFGDSKKMFREHLQKFVAQGYIDESQIPRISGLRFSGWGRMSKELLNSQGIYKSTDDHPEEECLSIIDALWKYSMNFQELAFSNEFTFREVLEKKRHHSYKVLNDFTIDDLDEFYFSPAVKRMMWRTILVVREVIDVMGCAPERVFIEMVRQQDTDKKSNSKKKAKKKKNPSEERQNALLKAYKKIKDSDGHEWQKEIQEAAKNGLLKRRRVFLYYAQLGRDVYTGKEIPLEEIVDADDDCGYNIDHIYPRHYVKDENILSNLVLVDKQINTELGDKYPLPTKISGNPRVSGLWRLLHENGLMSDEKYKRLTNRDPFTEQQMGDFIAKQLVGVSQGMKGVAALLSDLLPKTTKIVYAKSDNVAEFRQKFNFPKLVALNNLHYAQDAYLNIVVGNVYFVKFTQDPWNFIRMEYALDRRKNHYNLDRMYDWPVSRNGEYAWTTDETQMHGTIHTVERMMSKTSALMTAMCVDKSGKFSKETIYAATKTKDDGYTYIPIKTADTRFLNMSRYGGHTAVATSSMVMIRTVDNGKPAFTIEPVFTMYRDQITSHKNGLEWYCREVLGYDDFSIECPNLKIGTLVEINGYRVRLSGRTSGYISLRNAENMYLPQGWQQYAKNIERMAPIIISMYNNAKKHDEVPNMKLNPKLKISSEKNIELYDLILKKHKDTLFANRPTTKKIAPLLTSLRDKFVGLSVPEQCMALFRIFQLTRIGVIDVDMRVFGMSKDFGAIKTSQKLDYGKNKLIFIRQSVTGLFETKMYLDEKGLHK